MTLSHLWIVDNIRSEAFLLARTIFVTCAVKVVFLIYLGQVGQGTLLAITDSSPGGLTDPSSFPGRSEVLVAIISATHTNLKNRDLHQRWVWTLKACAPCLTAGISWFSEANWSLPQEEWLTLDPVDKLSSKSSRSSQCTASSLSRFFTVFV